MLSQGEQTDCCVYELQVHNDISYKQLQFCVGPAVQSSVSPECSSDGVSQAEASQAAEVQGEAVVMGGGRDGHFGSRDTDR